MLSLRSVSSKKNAAWQVAPINDTQIGNTTFISFTINASDPETITAFSIISWATVSPFKSSISFNPRYSSRLFGVMISPSYTEPVGIREINANHFNLTLAMLS